MRVSGPSGCAGLVLVCVSISFVALKWGGSVDVRWRMCTGGKKGLVCEGCVAWGPYMIVSMLSSGWYVVEEPGVSWRTMIGPWRMVASAFMCGPG